MLHVAMEEDKQQNLQNTTNDSNQSKVGFFAIVGKPNAGKSSLTNKIVGQKVSIVSYKPQTTRNRITGIYSDDDSQLVFLDTPGFIGQDSKLNEFMSGQIRQATNGVDGIIFVIDGNKGLSSREEQTLVSYSKVAPLIIAINKTDEAGYDLIYPTIQTLNNIDITKDIFAISAKTGDNVDMIINACKDLSPLDHRHYDDDCVTDRTLRFMVGEIIREKILLFFEKEIPHGVGVAITEYTDKKNVAVIKADIVCAKESHKPIIIGSGGEKIKNIGIKARLDIQKLVEKKVHLELFVKVREDWKNNDNYMNDIGYNKETT